MVLGNVLFYTPWWLNPKSVQNRRDLPAASAISAPALPNKDEYCVRFYSPPSSRNGVRIIPSLRCWAHLPHEELPQWCFTADVVSSAKWPRWIRRRWSADCQSCSVPLCFCRRVFCPHFCLPSLPVYWTWSPAALADWLRAPLAARWVREHLRHFLFWKPRVVNFLSLLRPVQAKLFFVKCFSGNLTWCCSSVAFKTSKSDLMLPAGSNSRPPKATRCDKLSVAYCTLVYKALAKALDAAHCSSYAWGVHFFIFIYIYFFLTLFSLSAYLHFKLNYS